MKRTIMMATALIAAMTGMAQQTKFSVSGRVTDERGNGIKDVVVNDGVHFTKTDAEGRWQMESDTLQSKFVSISTPSGCLLPEEGGLAHFYKPMSEAVKTSDNVFRLTRRKKPLTEFSYIAISDPQVRDEREMQRWRTETVSDLRHVADSLKRKREVIAMTLGDLVFDNMPLYDEYAETCRSLGVTTFQTIGNHDFDKRYQDLHNMQQGAPWFAEQSYFSHFGPTDYSFNIGNIHVITMKNINYVGRRKYIEALTGQQLEWLRHDLSFVEKGATVFINMHAAGWNKVRGNGNFRNAEDVEQLLKDYNVHFFCGHTHFFQNIEVSPTFYQHNIAAACGTWWAGDVSVCGAPNGYLVVDVKGNDVRWHYKPTKGGFGCQMRTYMPGEFRSQPGMVVANVWDYDTHCSVEYYEDGVMKGKMEQFEDADDAYAAQQCRTGKAATAVTGHLFRFKPAKETKSVRIVFTNRFGEMYQEERKLQ